MTRDVEPVQTKERTFTFPNIGTVKAANYQEALAKAKELIKSKK